MPRMAFGVRGRPSRQLERLKDVARGTGLSGWKSRIDRRARTSCSSSINPLSSPLRQRRPLDSVLVNLSGPLASTAQGGNLHKAPSVPRETSINAAFCANRIVGPVVWPTASARIARGTQTIRRSPLDSARAVTSAIADAVVVAGWRCQMVGRSRVRESASQNFVATERIAAVLGVQSF
jgi:hypothetical protein